MDELEQVTEYLKARQEAEIADQTLRAAKANYSPILGALFPEKRQQLEETAWKVMDIRDDAQRRAEDIKWRLTPEIRQIADEVLEQWKKEQKEDNYDRC